MSVKIYRKLMAVLMLPLVFSCTNEDLAVDILIPEEAANSGYFSYSMSLDAPLPHYDGVENGTRAHAGEWEDGDVVYLFLGGENEAYASATYNKEQKTWTLHSDKMLELCNACQCSVWYGKGGGRKLETEEFISYDYLTEAYSTESGIYTYLDGEVKVTASLQPFAKRLRFKGEPGTRTKIQGKGTLLSYNKINKVGEPIFDLSEEKNWDLEVKDDGYTDYRVFSDDASTVKLIMVDTLTLYTYSRYFDQKTLNEGESGCFTVPTVASHNGWTYGHEWQYEYVDLGLPSGTLWATSDVGAFKSKEYGYRYAWGETETKTTYNSDNYSWGSGYNTEELELEDDAVFMNWGEDWRMPTYDELWELLFNCSWTPIQYRKNGQYDTGYNIIGPNGSSIYLHDGQYWSNTRSSTYKNYAFSLKVIYNSTTTTTNTDYCYNGHYLRPVSRQKHK